MTLQMPYTRPTILRWMLLSFSAVWPALSHAGDVKPAAAEEKEQGFVSLVGDDAKKAWTAYGAKGWPKGWEVVDGVLHRKESSGDLMTAKEYGDFDLRFQWKISPGGNSGVMYRVSVEKDQPSYHTGPEYQILDNTKHADGKNPTTSAASLYALYAPAKATVKKVGEWNDSRIVLKGNRVEHYLNGEKVVQAELGGEDWKKRVAGSKFNEWKKFGMNRRGHVVLQDHGDEVWFRDVRIKEMK